MSLHRAAFLFLVALLAPSALMAQAVPGTESAHGWHFYEPDPPPKPPKPPTPPPQAGAGATAEPAPMSAAWLRAKLETYRDQAIDNPTPENLEIYGLMQRLAMDKSERFARGMIAVTQSNPALDESIRNPTSAFAKTAMQNTISVARAQALQKIASSAGLFYFFSSGCPYCHKQNPVLQMLVDRYAVKVLPISLDGAPMPDGYFPNYQRDTGQATAYKVMATPTFLMVKPPNTVVNLAVGIRTLPELEDRMLDVGLSMQLLSQNEYDEAKRGTPREFMSDQLTADAQAALANDPSRLLSALRAATVSGGSTPWANGATAPPVSLTPR